ncbi:oxidoreductase [Microtetraspora sp. NBRC 13810]|uniref:LLM class flavin-dependent oxidoreductase n=1 Tax=Microtetraspora sp. NBRC 13810 TaxID=3030990 RepID=UPI00249FFA8E|nr:LLM class flavin-dependent oxidoreductase [Microtetraspora sp. NBRC 13810]GLW09447.1 oxidoreductase [Microtetraspora sp. NBRC 13810]
MSALEFAVDTFGDVTLGAGGERLPYAQVIRNVVEEAVLADRVGIDAIGIGEHHRDDFAVSAPEIVLATIAGRTERIRLGTAVTVLSSDDPVRVFERFATLDAVSGGRAEIILGRGSFTESFPLFGYDLAQYEELFEEKLDLFSHLLEEGPVTWQGRLRPGLTDQHVYPKTESGRLRTWIGVGGSPESVVRAARYRMPLMLAIIGGQPERFAPYADLYRRALTQLQVPPLPIGVHSPGHIAETDEQAREELWPHYRDMHDRIGRERGWGPTTRARFEAEADEGALYAGSPETVAAKIAKTVRALGADRFELKYSSGTLAHDKMLTTIRLYGEEVVPRVRELLAPAVAPTA